MGVIITNQFGTVRRLVGKNIRIINGKVYCDDDEVKDIITDDRVINITIEGDVERLEVEHCSTIKVTGSAKRIHTSYGDIEIGGDVDGDVHTNMGDITCGNVEGDCHTNMGSIHRR